MALTLHEIYLLHRDGGALLERTTAACGVLCRAILDDEGAAAVARAWAQSVLADPDAASRKVFRGVVTDPTITALSSDALRAGTAPSDPQLLAVIQALLAKFVV